VAEHRPHDIGGSLEFGAIGPVGRDDEAPFHHEWEARVFVLNRLFLKRGIYTLDEFRDAIERMDPEQYHAASYYERWLCAIETLLAQKRVLEP
jgi:nitrile hydratase subunit beta